MIPRWHPSGLQLSAWFDGEAGDGVGAHVARCARCRNKVSEFGRIRAWVRAQPMVAMGEEEELTRPRNAGRRWVPVVAAVVLAVTLLRVGPPEGDDVSRRPDSALGQSGSSRSSPAVPTASEDLLGGGLSPLGEGLRAADQARFPADDRRPASSSQTGAGKGAVTASAPLRLGLVVPTAGSMADEGAEVREVVARAVAMANAGGGVGGKPVELLVAAAEDSVSVASLSHQATVLVGGFGARPPGDPVWLLPADPSITGTNVITTETTPRAAGVQLADLLLQRRLPGAIGVVLGSGPDAEMAAGLASRAATITVPARQNGNCSTEVASLRRTGAAALAVAGDAALAARCLEAATRANWIPPSGRIVPPSAAYGHAPAPEAWGAQTLLSLPWPTSAVLGATRFRETFESTSYRAEVSLAAVELAVEVARTTGSVTLASVGAGTWRSDLLTVAGTAGRSPLVVVAGPAGWLPPPPAPALRPF